MYSVAKYLRCFTNCLGIIILAFCFCQPLHAQDAQADSIDTESDDFVEVDMIVGTPLQAFYSVFGHAALRMQCPPHQLDYVCSFETNPDMGVILAGLGGKSEAKYMYIPYEAFKDEAQKYGRELRQCKINLTLDERKELWRLLDEEVVSTTSRHFNLVYDNCLSAAIRMLKDCLNGERIEWGPQKGEFLLSDGDYFRHILRHNPWAEFVFVTFMGSAYDKHSDIEQKLTPENLLEQMREASFVDDSTGVRRPVLLEDPEIVMPGKDVQENNSHSPLIVFLILLIVTMCITALQWLFKWHVIAVVYDYILFGAQALAGGLVIFMNYWSELFHNSWNWYLLVFLPVPVFLLLCKRAKRISTAWLACSLLLAMMMAATPFIGAFDLPHMLIAGSLFIRTTNNYFITKTSKNEKENNH